MNAVEERPLTREDVEQDKHRLAQRLERIRVDRASRAAKGMDTSDLRQLERDVDQQLEDCDAALRGIAMREEGEFALKDQKEREAAVVAVEAIIEQIPEAADAVVEAARALMQSLKTLRDLEERSMGPVMGHSPFHTMESRRDRMREGEFFEILVVEREMWRPEFLKTLTAMAKNTPNRVQRARQFAERILNETTPYNRQRTVG